jgi:importin subunit beta-1
VVAQVLQTAANVTVGENSAFEMLDYVISLREGIMDAWSGAILSMKSKRGYSQTFLYDLADLV